MRFPFILSLAGCAALLSSYQLARLVAWTWLSAPSPTHNKTLLLSPEVSASSSQLRGITEEIRSPRGTGSYANCIGSTVTDVAYPYDPKEKHVTVSCLTYTYRMPTITATSKEVFIGVLSGSGGKGPSRRETIRQTWGSEHPNVQLYFVVAGPWSEIKDEYDKHQDMIWLGIKEAYDHLTYKTMSFLQIMHDEAAALQHHNIKFVFKTDDDVFVNADYLQRHLLLLNKQKPVDYWGVCHSPSLPIRDSASKYQLSTDVYPEKLFPPYCAGLGYAISMKFVACAAGPKKRIANLRFINYEDVAVGMLAERCAIEPTDGGDLVNNAYRFWKSGEDGGDLWREEDERNELGLPKIDRDKLPNPQVHGKILQHGIYDEQDMKDHWDLLVSTSALGEYSVGSKSEVAKVRDISP